MQMIRNRQGRMVPEAWSTRDEHYRIKDNLCLSCDEFAEVILTALRKGTGPGLSAVRMSDGEDELLLYCKQRPSEELVPNKLFPEIWQKRLGIYRIRCAELLRRLDYAATHATYFSPDGERNHLREHWPLRERSREERAMVELYYPYRMKVAKKREMFNAAGNVLIVNGYQQYIDAIRAGAPGGVKVDWVCVRSWEEHDDVLAECRESNARLVLVSAGPAGKWLMPKIQETANVSKVVLDIGDGMGSWWWENGVSPEGKFMSTSGELEDRK